MHVGQLRTPPKARDYRKLHLAVDEQTSDVVACELTSKRARDASRVASLVGQIERPIASAKADAAYDTGDVYKTLENHRAHRSPKVLIPPRKGAQLALDSAGTRQRNRNIRARSRVGKRKWYVASGYSRRSKVETTFGQAPGQDLAARPVHHRDEVQKASLQWDIGNIRAPHVVRSRACCGGSTRSFWRRRSTARGR